MSQMPGDNLVPPTQIPAALADEDISMYGPANGQHTNTIPNPTQLQPVSDIEFGNAVLQELVQSRRSHERIVETLLAQQAHATPHSAGENGNKKLAADPQPFDGTSGKLEEFLSDLRLCFLADGVRFDTSHKRIIFALSYMKGGSAHAWAVNQSKSLQENGELWATWTDFEEALRGRFEMGDRKVEAQNVLHDLKQGGRPAEEYFDIFEAHRPYSGLNDESCVQLIRYGLHPGLLDSIYNQSELPKTYQGWKDLAIRQDRQFRERRALSKRQGSGQNPSNPRQLSDDRFRGSRGGIRTRVS